MVDSQKLQNQQLIEIRVAGAGKNYTCSHVDNKASELNENDEWSFPMQMGG